MKIRLTEEKKDARLPMTYVVIHSLGGKTTAASAGLGFDVDSARTTQIEQTLQPLRAKRRWKEHDAIWLKLLKTWVASLPEGATVFVHHYSHARELAKVKPGRIMRYAPSVDEFIRRLADVVKLSADRAELAIINRGGLMDDPTYLSLPEWDVDPVVRLGGTDHAIDPSYVQPSTE